MAFSRERFSYASIDNASDALAHSLDCLGVGEGDRVALLLPDSPQLAITRLAVWKLGAVCAPQSLMSTERELQESLAACGAETVVVLTPYYRRLKNVQGATRIRRVVATNLKEYLPPLRRARFTLFDERREGHRIDIAPCDYWLQRLIEDGVVAGAYGGRKHGTVSLFCSVRPRASN